MNEELVFSIIGFLLNFLIIYILGSFVAWDFNPLNWWLFTSSVGRIIMVIILIVNFKVNFIDIV